MSVGVPVPVAHYFADLRAVVAVIFRTWPEARPYAGTRTLSAVLDAEHASRAARAQPPPLRNAVADDGPGLRRPRPS